MISRSLRLQSDLPVDLWPDLYDAACHLINRWPIEAKDWKTPHEIVFNRKPEMSYISTIGSKAFVLRKNIPHLDKLESRCWIGYLTGFIAHNIWKVWNPRTKKTTTVRDVKFDETTLYKALDHGDTGEILQLVDVTLVEREIQPVIIPVQDEPQIPQTPDSTRDNNDIETLPDDDVGGALPDDDPAAAYATPPESREITPADQDLDKPVS